MANEYRLYSSCYAKPQLAYLAQRGGARSADDNSLTVDTTCLYIDL